MNIQMVDLQRQYQKIKSEIDKGIQEVLDSTAFIRGLKVNEFQKNLENYLGVKHVIPVGNGTDALQIALMALGLKPGDEVITPTFTFIATAEVVALLGLTPVVVDVDPETFCLSIESVKNAITPKTKAIVPVHLFGQNADMEGLMQVAKQNNLYIVEDACQSIGSEYTFSTGKTVKSGCIGDIGCTSFFPSKNLGCFGDGGAIFTNNDELASQMRVIANHGMVVKYHHDVVGINSRLDTIQAAVLDVKLKYLDRYNESRKEVAAYYNNAFSVTDKLVTPTTDSKTTHVFHQYTLQLKDINREDLQKHLASKGIPTMIYYPIPLHFQKAYQNSRYKAGDFPVAENLSKTVLSLPIHTEMTQEELKYITDSVLEFVKQ